MKAYTFYSSLCRILEKYAAHNVIRKRSKEKEKATELRVATWVNYPRNRCVIEVLCLYKALFSIAILATNCVPFFLAFFTPLFSFGFFAAMSNISFYHSQFVFCASIIMPNWLIPHRCHFRACKLFSRVPLRRVLYMYSKYAIALTIALCVLQFV